MVVNFVHVLSDFDSEKRVVVVIAETLNIRGKIFFLTWSVVSKMPLTPQTRFVDALRKGREWVHVEQPERVEKILEQMIAGGKERLQFVVDFDYTLTRAHKNGKHVDNSWGIVENSSLLPKSYTDKTNVLKAKYLKYELDPTMSVEEKIPYIVEWYTLGNELLKESRFNRAFLPKMVGASSVEFREDTDRMFKSLHEADVPVMILSAGLGDLVVETLEHFELNTENVNTVSNFLAYDEEGFVKGIDGAMIHVFNKNECNAHEESKHDERDHVVLMGDSLGDLQMSHGIKDMNALLKIGFLNSPTDKKLDVYKDAYDIVLLDDQTMDVPNDIIEKILFP